MITLHFISGKPKYLQIYAYFAEEIKQKRIKAGEQLPPRRQLAEHLGVSLNTVKTAYGQLLDEGYVIARERSGFFVDKLSFERTKTRTRTKLELSQPLPAPANTEPAIKYNFAYAATDSSRLPRSILKKCAQHAVDQAIAYGKKPRFGLASLREEIARYLATRRAVHTAADNIVISSGYLESLMLINSVLENAVFAMEDPGYSKTLDIFARNPGKIISIPLDKYGFSVRDLEQTPANIAIVTPNHQFPTGIIMGLRRRQRLLNWAYAKNNRYIIEDDYNSDFKYSGTPIPALKSLDKLDRVILSGSFSESIGGFLGISYLVLPAELKNRLKKMQINQYGASLLQQYTLQNFLQDGSFEKHLNRMNTHYRKKRTLLMRELRQYRGIEIRGADAGLHVILRLDETKYDLRDFPAKAKRAGISCELVQNYALQKWPHQDLIVGFGGLALQEIGPALKALLKLCRR